MVVCAIDRPRSAIISTRSRRLSLNRRYQRTHRMMTSRSKWRPSNSSSTLFSLPIADPRPFSRQHIRSHRAFCTRAHSATILRRGGGATAIRTADCEAVSTDTGQLWKTGVFPEALCNFLYSCGSHKSYAGRTARRRPTCGRALCCHSEKDAMRLEDLIADERTSLDDATNEAIDRRAFRTDIDHLRCYGFWTKTGRKPHLWDHQKAAVGTLVAYLNADKSIPERPEHIEA